MKKGTITKEIILTVFAILGALALLVALVWKLALIVAPVCWSTTIEDIKNIIGTPVFSQSLIGRESFSAPLKVSSGCGDKIIFGDYNRCIYECSTYEDVEKCEEECLKCKETKGCIIAKPIKPSKSEVFYIWNIFRKGENSYKTRVALAYLSMFKAFGTDFGFYGDTEIIPEQGMSDFCLEFKKREDVYKIKKTEKSRAICEEQNENQA